MPMKKIVSGKEKEKKDHSKEFFLFARKVMPEVPQKIPGEKLCAFFEENTILLLSLASYSRKVFSWKKKFKKNKYIYMHISFLGTNFFLYGLFFVS
jgi:hypothetical protein